MTDERPADHFQDQDALLREVAKARQALELVATELAAYLGALRRRTETETALVQARMNMPPPIHRGARYMSGRWPLRDGDTYGAVAPQPPVTMPSPLPHPTAEHGDFRALQEED